MPQHICRIFVLFIVCALCLSCASTNSSKSSAKAANSGVSQQRDPSRIHGDEKLDLAYQQWADKGYPVHPDSSKYELDGKATWYGPGLNGNKTASGEVFDMYGMTAAHKKLPFGTIVVVTNQKNNKSVVVRINDRGPFVSGRIIDLSYGAAYLVDMVRDGVVPVKVEIISTNK